MKEGKPWSKTGGHADTTEAAERALILAARYAKSPGTVATTVSSNCILTQSDEAIVAMTTAFCCVLALLVAGRTLDTTLSDDLMGLVKKGDLPFHAVTSGKLRAAGCGPTRVASGRELFFAGCFADRVLYGGSRSRS